jgi:hypothetical protein
MGPVATAVYAALSASQDLADVLTGGVHPTRLTREDTPGAFTETGRPLPAAAVIDRGEDHDPNGKETAFGGFPQVWFQAEATADGRAAVVTAWELARALIPRQVTGPDGTGAGVNVIGRVAVDNDPVIPGVVVGMMRLQADGLWAVGV